MSYVIVYLPEDLYWRPKRQGYTRQLLEAGVYSEDEARDIERCRQGRDKAVPLADALASLRLSDGVLAAIPRTA